MNDSSRIITVPNILTVLRLLALPVIIILFRQDHGLAAAGVFAVAMITDWVDGYLAKCLKQRTVLGLYLDPVVDKIVLLALFYELAGAGLIAWAVAQLFLARELLQNAVRVVGRSRGEVIGANRMGKTKAVLQNLLVGSGLLMPALASWLPDAAAGRVKFGLRIAAWAVLALAWCFFGLFLARNRRLFTKPD